MVPLEVGAQEASDGSRPTKRGYDAVPPRCPVTPGMPNRHRGLRQDTERPARVEATGPGMEDAGSADGRHRIGTKLAQIGAPVQDRRHAGGDIDEDADAVGAQVLDVCFGGRREVGSGRVWGRSVAAGHAQHASGSVPARQRRAVFV